MADSDIKIKAVLDSSEVKNGLQKLGQDVDASMSSAAASADKLSRGLDGVSDSAKISAKEIGMIALSMSGVAIKLASQVAESKGYDKTAGYLKGVGNGAIEGAALGGRVGGVKGAIAGAVIGGTAGGVGEYFNQEKLAKEAEQKKAELIESNSGMLTQFDELRQASDVSSAFFKRMADETTSASDRQAELNARMAEFQGVAATLRDQLATPALQADAKKFGEVMKEYATASMEVSKMSGTDIKETTKKGSSTSQLMAESDSLAKLGITVGGGSGVMNTLATLSEKANTLLGDVVGELKELNQKPTGAIW